MPFSRQTSNDAATLHFETQMISKIYYECYTLNIYYINALKLMPGGDQNYKSSNIKD